MADSVIDFYLYVFVEVSVLVNVFANKMAFFLFSIFWMNDCNNCLNKEIRKNNEKNEVLWKWINHLLNIINHGFSFYYGNSFFFIRVNLNIDKNTDEIYHSPKSVKPDEAVFYYQLQFIRRLFLMYKFHLPTFKHLTGIFGS